MSSDGYDPEIARITRLASRMARADIGAMRRREVENPGNCRRCDASLPPGKRSAFRELYPGRCDACAATTEAALLQREAERNALRQRLLVFVLAGR